MLCIRYRWEGEMGSSLHKSPGALRRGLDVATVLISAHLAIPTMSYAFSRTNIYGGMESPSRRKYL